MKNWYTLHINIMQGVPIFVNLFGTGSHAVWGYPHPVLATLGESQKSLYPLPSLLFRCFCDFQSFLYLKNAVFKIKKWIEKRGFASPSFLPFGAKNSPRRYFRQPRLDENSFAGQKKPPNGFSSKGGFFVLPMLHGHRLLSLYRANIVRGFLPPVKGAN